MDYSDILDRHERIVLQFSGGKDSLATLFLMEPWWGRMVVAWCNTGAAFPETQAIMNHVRRLVPNFHEVRPVLSQPDSIRLHGYPVDLIPTKCMSPLEELAGGFDGPRVQHFLHCCNRLIFKPMLEFVTEHQATLVIRGQRRDEPLTAPIQSGDVVDGVEYLLPIEDWTAEQVLAYLIDRGVPIPEYYSYTPRSLDCWSCTAYLDETPGLPRYMREHHPEKWTVVERRLLEIDAAISREKAHLDKALGRSPSALLVPSEHDADPATS